VPPLRAARVSRALLQAKQGSFAFIQASFSGDTGLFFKLYRALFGDKQGSVCHRKEKIKLYGASLAGDARLDAKQNRGDGGAHRSRATRS